MLINTTADALDNLNKKLGGADIDIEPSTNKVDALKKIYKTLGGTDDVSGLSTVFQVLEKITEVAEVGGGGGGDSDFSTATLRLINGQGTVLGLNVAYTDSFDEYNFTSALINTVLSDDVSYNVILYKGEADAIINDPNIEPIISGDITYEDGVYIITGDCSMEFER